MAYFSCLARSTNPEPSQQTLIQERSATLKENASCDRAASSLLVSIASRAVATVFAGILLTGSSPAPEAQATPTPAINYQVNCNTEDNLHELAGRFIEKCRKGSIRREFPSQHLGKTLGQIKNGPTASYKKAWKLLNDNRYNKYAR